MITVTQFLEKTLSFIDTPEKWVKGKLADYKNNTACAFCTIGAMREAEIYFEKSGESISHLEAIFFNSIDALKKQIKSNYVAEWNDHPERKYEEVVAAIQQTIIDSK